MKKRWFKTLMAQVTSFFRSLHMKSALRSAYEKLAPVGSWRYRLTRGLIHGIRRQLRLSDIHYRQWIACCDTLDETDLQRFQEQLSELELTPTISILMPVYNPTLDYLDEAIQSVRNQVYPHWELCIADDASTQSGVHALIQSQIESDARIKVIFREQNGHISAASNSALALATGAYVALLDHDDRLHPLAILRVVQAINKNPQCEVIYSDEDKLTAKGKRIDPYYKSDFDYDLLLGQNMISHLGVYRTETVREVGGFRLSYEGSQDYDLVLRVIEKVNPHQIIHIPKVLYHWRISEQSVATNIGMKPYALDAGAHALRDHLKREKITASVETFRNFGYRIYY
ncbi:MAG: glycosyltransferase family 2 protein, partial [Anaerolineales bacterium]